MKIHTIKAVNITELDDKLTAFYSQEPVIEQILLREYDDLIELVVVYS